MNYIKYRYLKGAKLPAIQMVCYSDKHLYSGLLLSAIQVTILIHIGQIVCFLNGDLNSGQFVLYSRSCAFIKTLFYSK